MISLNLLFYFLILLFIIIGALRGWGKEVLVCFAGILALTIIEVILPKVTGGLAPDKALLAKWMVILVCIFIGYQTTALNVLANSIRLQRSSARDMVMGALMGALNGYIIFGSMWYFMAAANYPIAGITAPDAASSAGQAAARILSFALPNYLHAPVIYYALIIGCLIVLGVFL
ncbi:MAG: CvpA family protein [Anaerolineaceae bacterium]